MHQEPTISSDRHAKCEGFETAMASSEVADLIVAYLRQLGVEYVFGVPGDAIEPLFAALARSRDGGGPKAIMACHETAAAFMADGYAQETGKPGVCCAAPGSGTTNLITGVACAYESGVPLLILTGQQPLSACENHGGHDAADTAIDTLSMFLPCTRYNTLVSHVQQVETKLVAALHKALQPPAGPVHLRLPRDILRSKIPSAIPAYALSALLKPSSLVDERALGLLLKEIRKAKNILLLIGGSCAAAIGLILQFAVLRRAVFVTTQDGKTLVNRRHPLYRGVIDRCGDAAADAALQDPSVDLILAVGFRMNERTRTLMSPSFLKGRLVHIDESEERLERTPMARLHVRGRILSIFQLLVERLHGEAENDRTLSPLGLAATTGVDADFAEAEPEPADASTGPLTPQRFMSGISKRFPPSTRYLVDSGNCLAWATNFLHPEERRMADRRIGHSARKAFIDCRRKNHRRLCGGRVRIAMDFTPRGYAIGAAVGAAAGNPNAPVVCITGDGGMLLNGQEIHVAKIEQLPVIFVLLNETAPEYFDGAGNLLEAASHHRYSHATDFAAFARALGADTHLIKTLADLQAIDFDAMCGRKGPTLLDVHLILPCTALGTQGPVMAERR